MDAAAKTNLLGLEPEVLKRFFAALGEKPFRAGHNTYTGLERQYRIMLEAIKILSSYEYDPEPPMPHFFFENWDTKRDEIAKLPKDKQADLWRRLNQNDDVKEYLKKLDENQSKNQSNAVFLSEMLDTLRDAKDEENYQLVLSVYSRFPRRIGTLTRKLHKATINEDKDNERRQEVERTVPPQD